MRGIIALAVLGSCLLLSTVKQVFDTSELEWFRQLSNRVGSLQKPAKAIKNFAVNGGDIGYFSDDPNRESLEYYGLQYQLIPSVLVFSPHENLVICLIHKPANLARIQTDNQLRVISEVGDGFFVLAPQVH